MEPVDLTTLRQMIDNDVELERSLFAEFFKAFEEGTSSLQVALDASDISGWQKTSHLLKGISLNLGAAALGALCSTAQDKAQAGADIKVALLENIRAEYACVHRFLQKSMA
jgi:HPt (histidine-containing phosphotransfer) domain-containing protein